jgi:hypothetical protein
MLEFAHFLDRFLEVASPYLITVAVILWAIAFGTAAIGVWRRSQGAPPRQPPLFVWAGLGFLTIVLSLCGAAVFLSHAAIDELRPRLNAPVREVVVNGRPAPDPERLLSALRQITSHNYRHSHPTKSYRVRLQTSEGPLELLLRRDSAVANEYWVYYPGFDTADDIGTVVTDALDGP